MCTNSYSVLWFVVEKFFAIRKMRRVLERKDVGLGAPARTRPSELNLGAVGLCPRESNRERRRLSPLAICSQPSELEHTTKGEEDYERASARARGARPSRRKTPRNQGERSLPPLPEGSALGGTGPEGPPIWARARNKAGRTVHCANLAPLPSRTLAARSFFFSFLLTKTSPSYLPPLPKPT